MSQRSPFNKRNQPQAEDEKKSSSGITRKSPTKAKPVREAASSVRVVAKKKNPDGSTSTVGMTKEEKKEVRRAEREEEDIFNSLTNAMLKADELYTSASSHVVGVPRAWSRVCRGCICLRLHWGSRRL